LLRDERRELRAGSRAAGGGCGGFYGQMFQIFGALITRKFSVDTDRIVFFFPCTIITFRTFDLCGFCLTSMIYVYGLPLESSNGF
jgi:hypothetical protein